MQRRSSAVEASGLFSGREAMNVGKRSGYLWHSSAIPSLQMRASSGLRSAPASASIGGIPAESTCT